MHTAASPSIAVVIPSFKVTRHIQKVIADIGPEVGAIYVIDDCCPDRSGDFVRQHVTDARVRVLQNAQNLGVGGATMAGYRQAADDGFSVIVKIDGDGQMKPSLIPRFIQPILDGTADYTKGNRFYNIEDVRSMPLMRLIGNAALSFITKISTGYWHLFDPTNGFTAIHARLIPWLPMNKISQRYFFESDLLFRLNTLGAVVRDIPMKAVYDDEESNLKIGQILGRFLTGHLRNFGKRIFYSYFLRNFSLASVELLLGSLSLLFGVTFGAHAWLQSIDQQLAASSGTVMLAALPVIIGVQLLLSFLNYDIESTPSVPIANLLPERDR